MNNPRIGLSVLLCLYLAFGLTSQAHATEIYGRDGQHGPATDRSFVLYVPILVGADLKMWVVFGEKNV